MQNKTQMEVEEAPNVMASPGTVGSVAVAIHPLVILNVSEHWTRIRAQNQNSQQVLGALIGKQDGRNIEVCNSFELCWEKDAYGAVVINMEYYKKKEEQYKQVFSDLDFVGWYTTGEEANLADLGVHKQICSTINESPIFLKLNPLSGKSELPVNVFESVVDLVGGEATVLFVPISYTLGTEEAERIGVDHVARVSHVGSASDESSVASNLHQQRSAIEMLHTRVKLLLQYVRATQSGDLPVNHEVMRELFSLIHRLPVTADDTFKQELSRQCSDVSLMAYLGAMTKGCDVINQYINKFNVLHDRSSGRRLRSMLL